MKIKNEINKRKSRKPNLIKREKIDKIDNVHNHKGNEILKGTKMVLIKKYKHAYETEKDVLNDVQIVHEYVEADLGDMLCDVVYFENSKTTPRIAHHFKII